MPPEYSAKDTRAGQRLFPFEDRPVEVDFLRLENGTHPEAGSFNGCAWAGFWGLGPHPAGLPGSAEVAAAVVTVKITMDIADHDTVAIIAASISAKLPAARNKDGAVVIASRPNIAVAWAGRNGCDHGGSDAHVNPGLSLCSGSCG